MQDEGQSSPLDDVPELTLDETIYYNDFYALCSERVGGMGLGNIPVTRIYEYAIQHGVHDVILFEKIIMRVDNGYIKAVSERQQRESKSKSK